MSGHTPGEWLMAWGGVSPQVVYGWDTECSPAEESAATLPRAVFDRLTGGHLHEERSRVYPSRVDAERALVAAQQAAREAA